MRIWAKLMTDGHIKEQYVYENAEKFDGYLLSVGYPHPRIDQNAYF